MADTTAPAPGFLFVTRLTANNPVTDGPFQTYDLAEKRARALKAQMPDSVVLISRIFARVIENPHKFLVESFEGEPKEYTGCFGPHPPPPLPTRPRGTNEDITFVTSELTGDMAPIYPRRGPEPEPELPASLDRRPKPEPTK